MFSYRIKGTERNPILWIKYRELYDRGWHCDFKINYFILFDTVMYINSHFMIWNMSCLHIKWIILKEQNNLTSYTHHSIYISRKSRTIQAQDEHRKWRHLLPVTHINFSCDLLLNRHIWGNLLWLTGPVSCVHRTGRVLTLRGKREKIN